jgi:hypothetical protein
MSPKRSRSLKRIYVVFYEPQDVLGNEVNIPIKAFKSKKTADIYASTRNFEFQTVCITGYEEDYESYVLNNDFNDYAIAMSDLRSAYSFFKEEYYRSTTFKNNEDIWSIIHEIQPFKVRHIEYSNDLY